MRQIVVTRQFSPIVQFLARTGPSLKPPRLLWGTKRGLILGTLDINVTNRLRKRTGVWAMVVVSDRQSKRRDGFGRLSGRADVQNDQLLSKSTSGSDLSARNPPGILHCPHFRWLE